MLPKYSARLMWATHIKSRIHDLGFFTVEKGLLLESRGKSLFVFKILEKKKEREKKKIVFPFGYICIISPLEL